MRLVDGVEGGEQHPTIPTQRNSTSTDWGGRRTKTRGKNNMLVKRVYPNRIKRTHTQAVRSKAGGSVTAMRGRPTDRKPTGHEGEGW